MPVSHTSHPDPTNTYVLITGASRGVGRALAIQFARHGHNLVLVARDQDALATLAAELTSTHNIQVHSLAIDLALEGGPQQLVETCRLSGFAVSTLINNAGAIAVGALTDVAPAALHTLIHLNVRAAAELSLAFIPSMRAAGKGCMINVSSLASATPLGSAGLYSASKAFLTHFTDALRIELHGSGITCQTVMLGPIRTDMLAGAGDARMGWMHHVATPPEVAAEIIYDGYVAKRAKYSAGMIGALLLFAATVLPARLVAPIMRRLT